MRLYHWHQPTAKPVPRALENHSPWAQQFSGVEMILLQRDLPKFGAGGLFLTRVTAGPGQGACQSSGCEGRGNTARWGVMGTIQLSAEAMQPRWPAGWEGFCKWLTNLCCLRADFAKEKSHWHWPSLQCVRPVRNTTLPCDLGILWVLA